MGPLGIFRASFWAAVMAAFIIVRVAPDNVDAGQLFAAEGLLALLLCGVSVWVECRHSFAVPERGPFPIPLKILVAIFVTALFIMFVDVWGRLLVRDARAPT
jgi:uncharacterized membrane protein